MHEIYLSNNVNIIEERTLQDCCYGFCKVYLLDQAVVDGSKYLQKRGIVIPITKVVPRYYLLFSEFYTKL